LAILSKAAYGIDVSVNQKNAQTFLEQPPQEAFPFNLYSIFLIPKWELLKPQIDQSVEQRFSDSYELIKRIITES